jgi:subtilisin-like proprotein convertase family protein
MNDLPHSDFAAMSSFRISLSSSNAFFGERARGAWTLELIDLADAPQGAALMHFDLRVVGH